MEMKTTGVLGVVLLRRYFDPIVYHLLLAIIWNNLLSSIGREWFILPARLEAAWDGFQCAIGLISTSVHYELRNFRRKERKIEKK
jgi:uncharacterized membrane protein